MLELVTTRQFRKDYKRIKRRGYDISLLECHISPDWLLIYATDREKLILTASRTGTHSDLFAK